MTTTHQSRARSPKDRRGISHPERRRGTSRPVHHREQPARKPRGAAGEPRESLRDFPPQPNGLLLVGMCTIAAVAKSGHYFEGAYGRRVWKKLATAGLYDGDAESEDECWSASGHGITDVVKRAVRSNDSLRRDEIAAGVEALRKKVRRWRPRAILFAFKNAAEAALGERGLSPGPLAAFEGVPALLLTGPYAKPEAAAEETRRLEALRN
jgi:uracil-DNA glycosylase